jgi:hypothetical protein
MKRFSFEFPFAPLTNVVLARNRSTTKRETIGFVSRINSNDHYQYKKKLDMEISISAISDGNRSSTLSALLLGKEVAMEELGAGSLKEGIKEGESRNDGDGGEREIQQEVIQ